MSNHLAVATATATLQRILQQAIQADLDGARVTTVRPDGSGGGLPETGVNVYLYHVKRNAAWTNQDTPNHQRRGGMVSRRRAALDLFYVLSFYGSDIELEPHRLLGSAVRMLEDQFAFTPGRIRETLNDPTFPFLVESDLAEQMAMVRSEFVSVSTDELSKIWSVFFQTPYALSVVYKVTVILLDSNITAQSALPVRDRQLLGSTALKQPRLEQVISLAGRYEPILGNSTLFLRGKFLADRGVQIQVCGERATPRVINDEELNISLQLFPPRSLRAGIQGLQVLHLQRPSLPTPATSSPNGTRPGPLPIGAQTLAPLPAIASNTIPFVLRPQIVDSRFSQTQGIDDDPRTGEIRVTTDLIIGRTQRTVLMLNECASSEPAAYMFDSTPLAEDSNTIAFSVRDLKPGEYLVRLQIDGAESVLDIDSDPRSPTFEQYVRPTLRIE